MSCKKIVGVALLLAYIIVASSAQSEWCEDSHEHEEDEEGDHPEDFLIELFHEYGTEGDCTISEESFEDLIDDLGIGDDEDDDHDDDDDDHEDHRRRRREVHETCFSAHELLEIHNISHEAGISEAQFVELAPALIQQIVQGCDHDDDDDDKKPSAGETYGYGTISVLLISLCAPLGLVVVRWSTSPAYKYIMATMLGLAVGALTGDALIHLLPHGFGLHAHEDEDDHDHGKNEVEEFVWKAFLACLAIWVFFNLQCFLQILAGGSKRSGESANEVAPFEKKADSQHTPNQDPKGAMEHGHGSNAIDEKDSGASAPAKANLSLGIMVSVGDAFHNFADGLAIGAAFTEDWQTGLATSIAVLLHEVAHEFGDVAAMLAAGWKWKLVLVIQLLTQLPAFLGLYIGIPIAERSEKAQQWIFCLAAGMFLYVALCDIVPELIGYVRRYPPFKTLIFINVGFSCGFIAMLLIGAFEEWISL